MKRNKSKFNPYACIFMLLLFMMSSCEYYNFNDIIPSSTPVSAASVDVNVLFDLSAISDLNSFEKLIVDISDDNDNVILKAVELKINSNAVKTKMIQRYLKFLSGEYKISSCYFVDKENNIFDGIAGLEDIDGELAEQFMIYGSENKYQNIKFHCSPANLHITTDQSELIPIQASIQGAAGGRIFVDWGDSEKEVVRITGKKQTISHSYSSPGNYNITTKGAIKSISNFVIDSCRIEDIDVSAVSSLRQLSCKHNLLTSIDLSKNKKLEILNLYNNQFQSLDVTKNVKLDRLTAGENELTTIDLTKNKKLTDFRCGNNLFTQIDVSKNTLLDTLTLCGNKLLSVDISNNPELIQVSFSKNQLTSFDITANEKLMDITVNFNNMNTEMVDQVISDLLTSITVNQKKNGRFEITKNAVPSATGLENAKTMVNQFGWKVLTDKPQNN